VLKLFINFCRFFCTTPTLDDEDVKTKLKGDGTEDPNGRPHRNRQPSQNPGRSSLSFIGLHEDLLGNKLWSIDYGRSSVMVMTPGWHSGNPGSIPGALIGQLNRSIVKSSQVERI
jgi:hypothetical protein